MVLFTWEKGRKRERGKREREREREGGREGVRQLAGDILILGQKWWAGTQVHNMLPVLSSDPIKSQS